MRRTFFRELAKKENGKFYFKDQDTASAVGLGVRSPNVNYIVKFSYKDHRFSIFNSTGTSFVGRIVCKVSSTIRPIEFELTSISHFKNLFLRRKSRFAIKTENENLRYFLLNSSAMKELNEIAKKEAFDPTITCEANTATTITTTYHLEFDDWTQVVEPIIDLYKSLIDEFEKGQLNISNKAYKELN